MDKAEALRESYRKGRKILIAGNFLIAAHETVVCQRPVGCETLHSWDRPPALARSGCHFKSLPQPCRTTLIFEARPTLGQASKMPELNSLLACPAKSGLFALEKGTHFTEMLRKRVIFFFFFPFFLSSPPPVFSRLINHERWIHMALHTHEMAL